MVDDCAVDYGMLARHSHQSQLENIYFVEINFTIKETFLFLSSILDIHGIMLITIDYGTRYAVL